MYFENFIQSDASIGQLDQALSLLRQVQFPAVLLELASKNQGDSESHPIEHAALSAARTAGYRECIDDIFNFMERYRYPKKQPLPPADFGAASRLYQQNEIGEDEYERLTGRKPTNRPNSR